MTATSAADLALPLAAAPAAFLLLGAVACLWRRTAVLGGAFLALATLAAGGGVWAAAIADGAGAADRALFTWSPLGLYGVRFFVRPSSAASLLALLPAALALVGWAIAARRAARRRAPGGARSGGLEALALVALAGAAWCAVAGDLVSLFLAASVFFLASTGFLAAVAGPPPGGRRLATVYGGLMALLGSALVLGKVNGHFQLSQLSTAGFTTVAFAGIVLAAAVAAPIPPFHGWVLRVARQPLAPALAAAGASVALALLLLVFRTTTGQFAAGWQPLLAALGWLTALTAVAVAVARRTPTVRLAGIFLGRCAMALFAAAVATPGSMAAALFCFVAFLPAPGLLWLAALARRSVPAAERVAAGRGRAAARTPGFWLLAIAVASASGLPLTIGGTAKTALLSSVTAWPTGDHLLRVPLALLDLATLVVAGRVLWDQRYRPALRGWLGWAAVAGAAAVVVAPALAPALLVTPWFTPAADAATSTGGSSLVLELSIRPAPSSLLLGALAVWVLAQRLRGREWLPAFAYAVVGGVALAWLGVRQEWRRRGWRRTGASGGDQAWLRVQSAAGRAVAILRPLEERYYAGAAVLVAVAIIYIIGR